VNDHVPEKYTMSQIRCIQLDEFNVLPMQEKNWHTLGSCTVGKCHLCRVETIIHLDFSTLNIKSKSMA